MILECRHIKLSGGKCGSPALKGKPYCYFHSRMKERANQPPNSLEDVFANLEDRGAIQHALSAVGMAFAARRITGRDAGVFGYILQTASSNAKNADLIVSTEAVSKIIIEDGQEMAPRNATSGPAAEPSLADLLQKELKKQRKEHAERLQEAQQQPIPLQSNHGFSGYQTPQPEENRDLTGKSEGDRGFRRIFDENGVPFVRFEDI
jgi:hypothetical protein